MTVFLTIARDPSEGGAGLVGLVIALGVIWAGGYAVACLVWPFGTCTRCHGARLRSPSGHYWRDCRKCHGTGRRVRLGRRIFQRLRYRTDD